MNVHFGEACFQDMREENGAILGTASFREIRVGTDCSGLGPEHYCLQNLGLAHKVRCLSGRKLKSNFVGVFKFHYSK